MSGDFALEWAEKIAEGDDGAVVIDNSSAFRYKEGVPLVVPEINAEVLLRSHTQLSGSHIHIYIYIYIYIYRYRKLATANMKHPSSFSSKL